MQDTLRRINSWIPCACLCVAQALVQVPREQPFGPYRTRGHVVGDGDGVAVQGATVLPQGATKEGPVITDANGTFELLDVARCSQSNASDNRGIDYLRVSAPGHAVTYVDPCSHAPWADPVRLRATAVLAGRLDGGASARIWVSVPLSEVSWPPRTGLTLTIDSWYALADAQGVFEVRELPAQVPLTVQVDVGDAGVDAEFHIVLFPGERRTIDVSVANASEVSASRTEDVDPDSKWVGVEAFGASEAGPVNSPWFEFVHGGRLIRHLVGGGRWHVHHYRACSHLEIVPGPSTLVGRDADGLIAVVTLDIDRAEDLFRPIVILRPGALLRLDGSALPTLTHIALSSDGVTIVEVDMLPGTVRYEVVPAGSIEIRLEPIGEMPERRAVDAPACEVIEVAL